MISGGAHTPTLPGVVNSAIAQQPDQPANESAGGSRPAVAALLAPDDG